MSVTVSVGTAHSSSANCVPRVCLVCVCVYVSCVAAACYDMLKEALEKRPHYTEGGWGGDEHGRVMESGMKMEGGRSVVRGW